MRQREAENEAWILKAWPEACQWAQYHRPLGGYCTAQLAASPEEGSGLCRACP